MKKKKEKITKLRRESILRI